MSQVEDERKPAESWSESPDGGDSSSVKTNNPTFLRADPTSPQYSLSVPPDSLSAPSPKQGHAFNDTIAKG